MAKEISHITIYKENKNTLTKLVQRICHNHQCTAQDALDALNILFKNSIAADFENTEKVSESKLFESLMSPESFMKIFESKTSEICDVLCGHNIQLPKGLCKITSVDGDTITVKCQDESSDKISYKDYFGQDLVTEALVIDDVTQYGDNLLVTLNGHLYAYQPLKDSGKTVEDLLKSVKGMMKHSVGKALQYLKKNSVLVPETSKK